MAHENDSPATVTLSDATRERLKTLFPTADRAAAERLLVERCGSDLPALQGLTAVGLERFRFAALKLSGGTIAGLQRAIELANTDWRDLLMAAGFGEDATAHTTWRPTRAPADSHE